MRVYSVFAFFCLLVFSTVSNAQQNFYSAPFAPYPPACATDFGIFDAVPGESAIIAQGIIDVEHNQLQQTHPVNLTVWRKGCAEDNRSLLYFSVEVIDNNDGDSDGVRIPYFTATVGNKEYQLRPVMEPNSTVVNQSLMALPEGKTIYYILDGLSIFTPDLKSGMVISPEEYNSEFVLNINNVNIGGYTALVPAYRNELQPNRIALNGRMSGIWVVDGAKDQGNVISFSEMENGDGLAFFSWYTYDSEGNLLWLQGANSYEMGDTRVTFDVELVTNGEFLGNKTANREVIGSIRLTGISCNNLEMRFDLNGIGLGSGTERLERIFSLETQGYACRDAQARFEP